MAWFSCKGCGQGAGLWPGFPAKIAVKAQVYREFGIRRHRPREYEVGHLVSLELGGSNSIKNLWPESYETQPWNAHVKDKLENELHREICSDRVELGIAQQCISRDWIACYKRTFHTDGPLTDRKASRKGDGARATRETPGANVTPPSTGKVNAESAAAGRVWVNTKSGKYLLPGSRYYGKTKEGEYMTEADAVQKGYTQAK